MQLWQRGWREGLSPQLTRAGLVALRNALARDDNALVQGMTTSPPGLEVFAEAPVEAACALGICGWRGDGRKTVGDLTAFFEKVCASADDALGEPGLCRHFLHWFDEAPRSDMRRQLLREVDLALKNSATAA